MNETWSQIVTSKKFIAAIATLLVTLISKIGFNADPETVGLIISPLIVYIAAQGAADLGKEKARIENEPKMVIANKLAENASKKENS